MFKTFRPGGIHPSENKITAGSNVRELSLPGQVSIPLNQHIGAPPKVLVERGDMVKVGQLIAQGEGFISANIHSSVSGKVVKLDADENPNIVMQYQVMGIPTLLFFKDGEIKERITGYMPKDKLVAKFSPHFN